MIRGPLDRIVQMGFSSCNFRQRISIFLSSGQFDGINHAIIKGIFTFQKNKTIQQDVSKPIIEKTLRWGL
jgi:hypothetical protein